MTGNKRTEWADFFDQAAPVYDEHGITKNTLAEVGFLVRSGAAGLVAGAGRQLRRPGLGAR